MSARTCSRRLKPFIEARTCGKEAVCAIEARPFGASTNPSAVLRVEFCDEHAAEYIGSGHGWVAVEIFVPAASEASAR